MAEELTTQDSRPEVVSRLEGRYVRPEARQAPEQVRANYPEGPEIPEESTLAYRTQGGTQQAQGTQAQEGAQAQDTREQQSQAQSTPQAENTQAQPAQSALTQQQQMQSLRMWESMQRDSKAASAATDKSRAKKDMGLGIGG